MYQCKNLLRPCFQCELLDSLKEKSRANRCELSFGLQSQSSRTSGFTADNAEADFYRLRKKAVSVVQKATSSDASVPRSSKP